MHIIQIVRVLATPWFFITSHCGQPTSGTSAVRNAKEKETHKPTDHLPSYMTLPQKISRAPNTATCKISSGASPGDAHGLLSGRTDALREMIRMK